MLNDYLEKCCVIGAAGKMGRGIALLLLGEMARMEVERTGRIAGEGRLFLVDVNDEVLSGLTPYLRPQLVRYAEKSIVALRECYKDRADLVENREIIDDFVNSAMSIIRLETDVANAGAAKLFFEAIVEKVEVKAKVFGALKEVCDEDAFFLTNTSSIPISVLDEAADLEGRLIGFHFYNPPPVQKLVEVIPSAKTDPKLKEIAADLGKRLRKTLVPANDVAGFVGNGHFMRDALFGMELAGELGEALGDHQAVYMANKVSEELLVRPMGVFQLMDYVGLDVCQMIMGVMSKYITGQSLSSNLIDEMISAGAAGGQFPDGSQKDGFFKYAKGKPAAVYSLPDKQYVALDGDWVADCDAKLGPAPASCPSWKSLGRDPKADEKLAAYFADLYATDTCGADLARRHLLRSREIARQLVADGVAADIADVNTVLMNGFYHLYGPENDYIQEAQS